MGWFWDSDEEVEAEKNKKAGKVTDTCLLIDYIDKFAERSIKTDNPSGWDNFKAIDAKLGTSPADIISSMTSRGGIEEFMNMDSTTLGLMVPKIRLFKQYYTSEKDTVGKSIEYLFDDSFDNSQIESILSSGRGRSGGAGIKEVNWEFNGTNPAEAPRVISVSMKLVFQSAEDLLGARYNPVDGTISAEDPDDDIINSIGEPIYTKNYVDLILHSPQKSESFGSRAKKKEANGEYVPKFYRLKMVVGWAVPDGNFPNLSNQPQKTYQGDESPKSPNEKLKEELRAMELSIFLNLVSHELTIEENGQLSLSIDYIGSLEETINGNTANVLEVDRDSLSRGDQANLSRAEEQDPEGLEDKKKEVADLKKKLDCLDLNEEAQKQEAEEIEKNIKSREKEIKEDSEQIKKFDSISKSIIYKQFLERLNDKVMTFSVNESQATTWAASLQSVIRAPYADVITGIKLRRGDALTDAGEAATNQMTDNWVYENTAQKKEDKEKETNAAIKENEEAINDIKEVNFVYFGDILNLACEAATTEYNSEYDSRMKILTGPVIITHPRGDKQYQMNLADIPIAYEDFQNFYFETVVRKELASYPLRTFIKDVLERLVKKALQPRECFAEGREQRQIDIGMTNYSIRSSTAQQMGLTSSSMTGRFNIDSSTFNNQNPAPADPDSDYNCLLLFMTSYASYDLRGDEEDDKSKGIYHYFIGKDTGLIQKIEFSRSDVQGLREARQAEERNLGQIRDVYNANVRMVGNTLYIPGMKVFLNPPFGFGSPTLGSKGDSFGSLSNLLGIGGYYDVIKVQSTISRGSVFSTELDCVFAQSGGQQERMKSFCENLISDITGESEEQKNETEKPS